MVAGRAPCMNFEFLRREFYILEVGFQHSWICLVLQHESCFKKCHVSSRIVDLFFFFPFFADPRTSEIDLGLLLNFSVMLLDSHRTQWTGHLADW